jgi:hypothetical protein
MRLLLPAALFLCSLQDQGRITLEKSDPLQALAKEIASQAGESVKVDGGIDGKTLDLKVRDAGLYQALDALCRAHGGATYLDAQERILEAPELRIRPGTWIEHPVSYFGNFRVAVHSFTRIKSRMESGDRAWVRVNLQLFHPPSLSATSDQTWSIASAFDKTDRDVRDFETRDFEEMVSVDTGAGSGTFLAHAVDLRDFDLAGGLKKLEGKATVEFGRRVDVKVPLEVGKKVETPTGTLVVESILEVEKGRRGSKWVISLDYQPLGKGGRLYEAFEHLCTLDGTGDVFITPSDDDSRLEIKPFRDMKRPKLLVLKAREAPRKVEIPFSFKDVVLKVE